MEIRKPKVEGFGEMLATMEVFYASDAMYRFAITSVHKVRK